MHNKKQTQMSERVQARKRSAILKNLRVTAIGGGHGLGRVLQTLSFLDKRLVGIVATTDNGGATGILRKHEQCIAWGDIRNCLSHLANQPLAKELLNYRFNGDSSLDGHNFGNLLLYTLDALSARPLDGIQLLSRLLKVTNRILPMSETPTDLIADLDNNMQCVGEIHIDELPAMPRNLQLSPQVSSTPEALNHIAQSDLVILGPGSFLTSVLPPLLVGDIAQAIANSSAKVIFVDNLVAENSPAGSLSLPARLHWLEQQLGVQPIDLIISESRVVPSNIPVLRGATASADVPHRHAMDSFLVTLEQAALQLLPTLSASTVNPLPTGTTE